MARIRRLLATALVCLLALAGPAGALEVRVDPRVEFTAVMCRLAGFEEFQGPGFADYDAAVDAHFGPFRDHPAVAEVRALREQVRLGYNMPAGLAVATGEGDWTLRLPAGVPVNGLDARWTPEAAERFLAAARALWTDSQAAGFFERQRPFHRQVEASLRADLDSRLDKGWFERQHGASVGRRFAVVPGLLNGPHSYGTHLVLPDGRVEAFAILGTPPHEAGQAPSYPADQAASLLVHEVHHPYVNPWVAANADRLAAGGQALYGAVEEAMVAASYGRWDYMLNETLVRSQVLRYYRSRGAMPGYWRNLQSAWQPACRCCRPRLRSRMASRRPARENCGSSSIARWAARWRSPATCPTWSAPRAGSRAVACWWCRCASRPGAATRCASTTSRRRARASPARTASGWCRGPGASASVARRPPRTDGAS